MLPKIPLGSRLPLLATAVILGTATVGVAAIRLTERLPINPWEPAIAMEAMRFNAGIPLYESGHATHMYGPLLTVVLAGIFRVAGLNLLAARIVFSIFAFGLAAFLATILCREKCRSYWLLAFLLFLAINFRTNLVFLSAQPDCVAALLGVAALCLWIQREKSLFCSALSIAFFVCAIFFKQTSAAFALIPFVHALMWRRPLRFVELATSLLPVMSISLTLAAIRFFVPQMFFAIVTVPATIKIYYERIPGITGYLLATFPIFVIALITYFPSQQPREQSERWIWSSILVFIPVSIWTICKSGGSYNSLLFAYLAMTALFVARLGAIVDWIASLPRRAQLVAATAIALAIIFSFLPQFNRVNALLNVRCGDDKYDVAVGIARRLGADVITPQDPTIAFRANGYFGRSLFFELDAHAVDGNWPSELPGSMQEELAHSAYVICVRSYVPTPVFERTLTANRFRLLLIPELSNSAYTVWTKNGR